jgi:hypothetical protein
VLSSEPRTVLAVPSLNDMGVFQSGDYLPDEVLMLMTVVCNHATLLYKSRASGKQCANWGENFIL